MRCHAKECTGSKTMKQHGIECREEVAPEDAERAPYSPPFELHELAKRSIQKAEDEQLPLDVMPTAEEDGERPVQPRNHRARKKRRKANQADKDKEPWQDDMDEAKDSASEAQHEEKDEDGELLKNVHVPTHKGSVPLQPRHQPHHHR